MGGVVAGLGERDLVCTPGALHQLAVNHVGPGPSLWGAQHDHRPHRPFGCAAAARIALDCRDVVKGVVESGGELLMHLVGIVSGNGDRPVAVTAQ